MKKYIVSAYPDSTGLDFTPWWENFLSSINYSESKFYDALLQNNAVWLDNESIEFDTEEDFLIFKLKFS